MKRMCAYNCCSLVCVKEFVSSFSNYKDSRIVLYGIGKYTAAVLSELSDEFNFVGLLDKDPDNIGKQICGIPILSIEEAEKKADFIVINTSAIYWKVIFHRIEDCKIPVFYLNGERALKKTDKIALENPYWNVDSETLLNFAKNYDVISFDIFDTLFQRSCFLPSDVFAIVERHAKKKFSLDFSFAKERVNACRNSSDNYISFDEIYLNLQKKLGISDALREWLKTEEIEIEVDLCTPRNELVEACNRLSESKKVYLVSDMYLSSNVVRRMLDKCNVSKNVCLWISVEKKASKKDGDIWTQLKKDNAEKKILHIGDNLEVDVIVPRKFGIDTFYIMRAFKMWESSSAGRFLSKVESTSDSMFAGLICKRLFSNPFALKNSNGKITLQSFEDLGYVFFGGLFLSFFLWLINKTNELSFKRLFFFARDGYWFVEDFNFLKSVLCGSAKNELKIPEVQYLPISRSLIFASSIDIDDGWDSILSFPYIGEFADFVAIRLHYKIPESNIHCHSVIELPAKKQEVENWLQPYKRDIIQLLRNERNLYEKHLSCFNISDDDAFVDLWFQGNNQYFLSKMLKKHLTGFYFCANLSDDNNCLRNNTLFPCFQDDCDLFAEKSNIKKMDLFIESFLTAPYGTILSIKDDGTYVCAPKTKNQLFWKERVKINDGVKEFIKDFVALEINELSPKFIDDFFGALVDGEVELAQELKDVFYRENFFIKEQEYPVFE